MPSRRAILASTLLLLAGAVVNVAVAWVLVGAPESWTRGGWRVDFDTSLLSQAGALLNGNADPPATDHQRRQVRAYLRTPQSWPEMDTIYRYRGLGWTVTGAGVLHEARRRTDAGWPARSVMVLIAGRGSAKHHSLSLPAPQRLLRSGWFTTARRDRIPLTPIPAGFAINTLFYTTLLAFPFTLFPLRRHLRARRGRCPKCGYDRTGLTDPAAPCPECGAAR